MARLRAELMVTKERLAVLQQIADEAGVTITSQPYTVPEPSIYICVLSDNPDISAFMQRARLTLAPR